MAAFTAHNHSEATVEHPVDRLWDVLTDPATVQRLTPLVHRITARGDRWHWELTSIPVLTHRVQPAFTEVMALEPKQRITFSHDETRARDEFVAADGVYRLREVESGTHPEIDLTIRARLPLPRIVAPAVEGVMHAVMTQMGNGFATALERHLRRGS
jgi:carbon monoxide dehydrogenase subunit G